MKHDTTPLKYENFPKQKHPLLKAILSNGGNPTAFARNLGVHQWKIYTWLNSSVSSPPAQYCRKIEQLTNGLITCEDLRPDVFGPVKVSKKLTLSQKFGQILMMIQEIEYECGLKNKGKKGSK